MALISDSLSVSRGRPARGSGAGAAGGPSARSPGLAVRFLWRRGPAPRQALCSPARLGRLPGPTCLQLEARLALFFLFKGVGSSPPCTVPARPSLPVCAVPGILTPGEPSPGLKEQPRPLGPLPAAGLPPPSRRLAAESPLPQEPAPISCPLTLSPVISTGEDSAGVHPQAWSSPGSPAPLLRLPHPVPGSCL